MKILCFTDSRGQFKNSFSTKQLFTEKLSQEFGSQLLLCPFKWTTTLDFIHLVNTRRININEFDKIVLYTGVVEFSPRPLSNYHDCYATKSFIEDLCGNHLTEDTYGVEYQGEDTKSLITIECYEKVIIPYLQNFRNKLILINTNKIVPNWEGSYINVNPSGRPTNIDIVAEYSSKTLGKFDNLINLLEWNNKDIQKYTVDNMHLTYDGSEYIWDKLKKMLI